MNKKEIIRTISDYEISIALPTKERLTYLDEKGKPHLRMGSDSLAPYLRARADKYKEYLRFGAEVDAVTSGKIGRTGQLKICDTPELLIQAGFQQEPMLYTQRHLLDALKPKDDYNPHRHGLTVAQVKRFPMLMESPVMLCDSLGRADVMLMVLNAVDGDGLPLIAAIQPDGRGYYEFKEIETNFVLSVYGRSNFAKFFEHVITPEKIIYFNAEKGQELSALAELQLFRSHAKELDLNTIIRQPKCLVKVEHAKQPRENSNGLDALKEEMLESSARKAPAKQARHNKDER